MYGVVYKIMNLDNGKPYVGQTRKAIRKRFLQHYHTLSPLGNAMRQFDIKELSTHFSIEIIERCETQAHLNEREIFWINALNSKQPNGYNRSNGGGGGGHQYDINSPFNERLKYLREHQELSQKELCSSLGLPTSTYCRYESGETQPTLTTLKLIANFFDVTVDYLLDNQIFTENELVDLQSFLENGNYTIFGKFPTHKDRQKLAAMLDILFK